MPNYAIVVAAGRGQRFGGLKQFYSFRNRPLLLYALDSFEASRNINSILVVVPQNRIEYTRRLIKESKFHKAYSVIAGGRRRQDSVLCALTVLRARSGIIAIHDGVRPAVSSTLVNRGIVLCRKRKAVIFGSPVCDTIKEVKSHKIMRTVPRNNLYLIQTPQFFEINLLRHAYRNADLSTEYTDEAALLESLGVPVYCYEGDPFNIKITKKDDFRILKKLL